MRIAGGPESNRKIAHAIAARFESPFLRHYARSKILRDPLYAAVASRLPALPVLDIGCGAGLMALYLRHVGIEAPLLGIDHDVRKIAAAKKASHGVVPSIEFRTGDARELPPHSGSVLLLDTLHYLKPPEARALLAEVAQRTAPGGVAVIRDGIRDGSWRYRVTAAAEVVARTIGWLKADGLHFPAAGDITGAFAGFDVAVEPSYGGTPFNNYLFVFRRSTLPPSPQ